LRFFAKGVFVLHKDYLMRQIEFISTAVAERLFFWKEHIRIEIKAEVRQFESDLLYVLLCDLVYRKRINEAENLLFDTLEPNNQEHLAIAEDFYYKLNSMSDNDLAIADFTREEIERGLCEIKEIYESS
jgi:hypothetical protein